MLGAQIPLSTFARTDPAVTGYGLGATAGSVSIIIGGYVLSLAVGALLLPVVGRRTGTRAAMVGAAVLVGVGYLLFLPFHDTLAPDDDQHGDRGPRLRSARRRSARQLPLPRRRRPTPASRPA